EWRPMFALGQKRTLAYVRTMSALPPKADPLAKCPLCAKSGLMHCNKLGSANSFGASAKRCELSRPGPIERNVLARIRCPLKLETERIDGTHPRLTPGYKLSGSGFRAGRVHELRIFSR